LDSYPAAALFSEAAQVFDADPDCFRDNAGGEA
jgi:hypothetical protein